MNRKISLYALFIIYIISYCTISGCIFIDDELPSDSYVVIQEVRYDFGEVILGDRVSHNLPPLQPYNYGNASEYMIVNSSFKALYGFYYERDSPWNYTTNLTIRGVYDYPYKLNSGAIIKKVDKNGNIYLTYKNKPITLKVGGITWLGITSSVIINETLIVPEYGLNKSYTTQYNTTWSIENKGIYNKSAAPASMPPEILR